MIKYKNIFLMATLALYSGCAIKTDIKAIKSAKITDQSIRYIGVAPFKNDNIAQSSQINSAMSNLRIDGNKYFTLIDRKNIDLVLNEKKLNDSGLVDIIKDDRSRGLSQMQTILTGEVNLNSMSSSYYKESRTDYDKCIKSYTKKGKTYCSKYKKYSVNCKANTYSVKTKVKLIKISDASITFSNNYESSTKYSHCSDDNNLLPSKREVNSRLANIIAQKFIKDIAPSYIYFTVTLLDDNDIDINNKQEKLLDNALTMIKYKRIEKANEMLNKLNIELKSKSYVVLYDLAITEESLGDVKKAYDLLKQAEDIALETDGVIKEIAISIQRVKKNIIERDKANQQL